MDHNASVRGMRWACQLVDTPLWMSNNKKWMRLWLVWLSCLTMPHWPPLTTLIMFICQWSPGLGNDKEPAMIHSWPQCHKCCTGWHLCGSIFAGVILSRDTMHHQGPRPAHTAGCGMGSLLHQTCPIIAHTFAINSALHHTHGMHWSKQVPGHNSQFHAYDIGMLSW